MINEDSWKYCRSEINPLTLSVTWSPHAITFQLVLKLSHRKRSFELGYCGYNASVKKANWGKMCLSMVGCLTDELSEISPYIQHPPILASQEQLALWEVIHLNLITNYILIVQPQRFQKISQLVAIHSSDMKGKYALAEQKVAMQYEIRIPISFWYSELSQACSICW